MKFKNVPIVTPCTVVVCFYLVATAARASHIAVTAPTSFIEHTVQGTWGWQFTTSKDITVTKLGAFDKGGDGLFWSTPLSLWTDTGSLLATATASAGVSDPLEAGYRWVDLTSNITLSANTNYRIAAYLYSDSAIYSASGHVFDPIVTHTGKGAFVVGANDFPGAISSTEQVKFLNASFRFVVPEPSTLALAGLGLFGVIVAVRRRLG